jgi:hypothetical protein
MNIASETILAAFKPFALVYCDRIGAAIFDALKARDPEGIIVSVGPVKSDLHPEGGYLVSTKKTLTVWDRNGRKYRISVEEAV